MGGSAPVGGSLTRSMLAGMIGFLDLQPESSHRCQGENLRLDIFGDCKNCVNWNMLLLSCVVGMAKKNISIGASYWGNATARLWRGSFLFEGPGMLKRFVPMLLERIQAFEIKSNKSCRKNHTSSWVVISNIFFSFSDWSFQISCTLGISVDV